MTPSDKVILFLAHGFGLGKAPKAPGTFGTIPGLLFFALALLAGNKSGYGVVCLLLVFVSVAICGKAEKLLGLKDPGSIVFDEMIAVPISLSSWVFFLPATPFRSFEYFFEEGRWITVLIYLGLFRFFDIAKPWPVRQSQSAGGGLGVTIDDVLAGLYAALAGYVLLQIFPSLPR